MTGYDALLLLSFGGPEGPEDVLPFLRNVTRGRGIPDERLVEVGRHYQLFGGVSPINAQNRALLAALRTDFAEHGLDLPVYWGNRNWTPYLTDTLAKMATDGVRRALVLVTAAYASYSGCRQYREDLAAAADQVGPAAPELDKLRLYYNHPGFVTPMVDQTVRALQGLAPEAREKAHLVFTTHSIPCSWAETAGPDGGAYVAQHLETAELVVAGVRARTGVAHRWDLVYQSRSGPPSQPWLEPDVNDQLRALSERGEQAAVLVPIGFVSDHMEVRYDLDVEAVATARELGLAVVRAATVGTDPRFVAMVRELVLERCGQLAERRALGGHGPSGDQCPAHCCPNPRRSAAGRA